MRSDGEEETQIAQMNPETTNQADPNGGAGSRTPRPACHGRGHAGPLGWAGWRPRRDTFEQLVPLPRQRIHFIGFRSGTHDLMYEAFESHDPMERVELAKKALEICPDCADAYVLLAEHTKNRKEALEWGRPVGPDHLQPPRQRLAMRSPPGCGPVVRLGLPLASRGLSYFGRLPRPSRSHSLEGSQRDRALEDPWRSPRRAGRATSSSRR